MKEARKDRLYRMNLYGVISDKGWSSQYMEQTYPLIKTLSEDERERWAAKALPIAQASKTEAELLEKIKTIKP